MNLDSPPKALIAASEIYDADDLADVENVEKQTVPSPASSTESTWGDTFINMPSASDISQESIINNDNEETSAKASAHSKKNPLFPITNDKNVTKSRGGKSHLKKSEKDSNDDANDDDDDNDDEDNADDDDKKIHYETKADFKAARRAILDDDDDDDETTVDEELVDTDSENNTSSVATKKTSNSKLKAKQSEDRQVKIKFKNSAREFSVSRNELRGNDNILKDSKATAEKAEHTSKSQAKGKTKSHATTKDSSTPSASTSRKKSIKDSYRKAPRSQEQPLTKAQMTARKAAATHARVMNESEAAFNKCKEWDEAIPLVNYDDHEIDNDIKQYEPSDERENLYLSHRIDQIKKKKDFDESKWNANNWASYLFNDNKDLTVILEKLQAEIDELSQERDNMLAKWNELEPRNNKYTKKQIDLSDKIANKIAQIDIKQWEKTRIPIFHRSNAIYSLRIEGDEQARESEWKYWAVYKDLNNQFMEWQVSKAFLDETFDPEFMKDFRKWFKFNNYMFLRNKKLSFVPVEKAQKYFEMKENAGIDKIWEYKKKENDETVLYLRAVVSFQQHTDKKIEELKTKKLGLFAADVVKKHVIRWALCLQPRQTDPTIHKYSKVKEEIVRAVFGVTKYAELIKDIYDWYEIDIEDCAEKNKANLKEYAKKRKDELYKRAEKKQKTANISKAIKNASVLRRPSEKFLHEEAYVPDEDDDRFIDYEDENKFFTWANEKSNLPQDTKNFVIDSPLGKEDRLQVYYWDFTDDTKYNYVVNFTKTQIEGIRFDSKRHSYVGLEKDPNPNSNILRHIELSEEWVQENFDDSILKSLTAFDKLQEKKKKFFKVPLADSIVDMPSDLNNESNPLIRYKQGTAKTCCFDALCSALYYLNYEKEASALHEFRIKFFQGMYANHFDEIDKCIARFIRSSDDFQILRKIYEVRRITKMPFHHPVLTFDCDDNDIRLLVLHGQDGGESHAICIVSRYIFDSNCEYALDLNEESLNQCCHDCNFEYVARGYHFKTKIIL